MKSVLVDSNIIIRIFAKDDKEQLDKAVKFFHALEKEHNKGIISILVISEVIWILNTFYKSNIKDFLPHLQSLINQKQILILEISKDLIYQSFNLMLKHNVDFTDAYLFANKGNNEIFSFDNDFKKLK